MSSASFLSENIFVLPLVLLKFISDNTPCRSSRLDFSIASKALLSSLPTFILMSLMTCQRDSAGTKKVYLSEFSSSFSITLSDQPFFFQSLMFASLSSSNLSDNLFKKSIPKIYSLYSLASIFPLRMSAAPIK